MTLVNARGAVHLSTNHVVFADTAWVNNTADFGAVINIQAGHWYQINEGYQRTLFLPGVKYYQTVRRVFLSILELCE